jgi:hypothetical protein
MAHPQVLSFLANPLGGCFPSELRQALPKSHLQKKRPWLLSIRHGISAAPTSFHPTSLLKQGQIIFKTEHCDELGILEVFHSKRPAMPALLLFEASRPTARKRKTGSISVNPN